MGGKLIRAILAVGQDSGGTNKPRSLLSCFAAALLTLLGHCADDPLRLKIKF